MDWKQVNSGAKMGCRDWGFFVFFYGWNEEGKRIIVGTKKEKGHKDETLQDVRFLLVGLHVEKDNSFSLEGYCRVHVVHVPYLVVFRTALKSDIFFFKKRSTRSLSSTMRFSNSYSPSSSSSAFASSTSSFSRSTSFFHRASSPTRVNLSAPSIHFSLDRSVSPNRSIVVAPRQANAHHHTSAPPSNHALVAFFVFGHRGRRQHLQHRI
ncbi:hypothetical protein Fmac_005210 [Flemingia macrophylla]|uniref:Uncharacterized protein n=1 Tax=Flemingia macrophylla TaxID=520843 RepID=A0ABD1N9Q8_9FABA